MHQNLIFSLLNLIAAAEGRSSLGSLEREQRLLLTFIASERDAGREVCIGDILERGQYGVAVTVGKRLRELEARGWIEVLRDPANHRRRLLGLTPKAEAAFAHVARKVSRSLPELVEMALVTDRDRGASI